MERKGRDGEGACVGVRVNMRRQDQHLERHSLTVASALELAISAAPSMADKAGRSCTYKFSFSIAFGTSPLISARALNGTASNCSFATENIGHAEADLLRSERLVQRSPL